jgi:5,10-methylenetetrahydromethanopterin reductase
VYHAIYERGGAEAVDGLPGGATWRSGTEAVPPASRHLATHEGHLIAPNERDRAALAEAPGFIAAATFTGPAADLRTRLDGMVDAGVTEIAYQPAGDIPRELRAFAAAAELTATG